MKYDHERRRRVALIAGHKLGSQGTHSRGKLTDDDEGDIKLMITRKDGNVVIDFGKPVNWLGLSKSQAVDFARMILKHAEQL